MVHGCVARHDWTMRRLVIGWTVCAIAALGGYLLYSQLHETSTREKVCAGVGLGGPGAPSPRGALDAYLTKVGGAPSDWKETDPAFSKGHEFSRAGRQSSQPDVALVIVDGSPATGFSVSGGCVGVGEASPN